MRIDSIIARRVPIDFYELFRQANLPPQPATLGRSKVANDWCLFVEQGSGLLLVVIKPPPMEAGETSLVIEGSDWVFRRAAG